MSDEQSSAEITLRLFVVARWVMLVLIAFGWTLQTISPGMFTWVVSWFPPPPEPAGTAAVVILLVLGNLWVRLRVLGRGRASTTIAGVHLLVDSVALTALLALSGGVTNSFTTMYFVPMTLATQLSPRWTWAVAAASLLGFAALFVLAPAPAGPPGHEHHFLGHIRGMWVAFGMSAAFMTYFVHRIALSLSRQRAELTRLRLAAEQDRQLAALGTLAAGAAHELGSPLGTVAMLVGDLGVMSEAERGDAIATIRQELRRCKTIVQQMSSPELRVPSLGRASEAWPLARLADELHDSGGELRLQIDVDASARGVSTSQPIEVLGQIVRAVVANAVDACRARAGSTGVRLRVAVEGDQAHITVIDDGAGMAPQAAAAAFDPFFSTKPEGQGMGLGLYLARAHLRALGGTIELASQLGHGTTVEVRFPLTEALRAAAGASV
ncbi:MAG: HAMP domain-containing histidine kinase [Nannocystis sp.]|uniref:sensor histidine kinase n=1 Tax=Nannocystis sp. TaxID=1962667 RepID=UPI002420BD76|nr:HAMP domain-containing sensor histidine kinase [Nannocystis sp.]MBK9758064.1 HAMP domain-containing histidine kinase [Nannocystis sp.]